MNRSAWTQKAGLTAGLLTLPLLSACNIFSFMDSPGTSAQYLSRARACLDAGDVDCARENYAKVSGDDQDAATSEEAFAILFDEGIELKDFFGALTSSSSSGSGAAVNELANKLATLSPGESKREALFEAYRLAIQISDSSAELRGLTRMVTSMSLVAEMLAESAGGDGIVNASDLVVGATTCAATTACETEPQCAPTSAFEGSTTTDTTDWEAAGTESLAGDKPSMEMIRSGLDQLQVAFGELGQEGSGASTENASEFADSFEGLPVDTNGIYDQCYMNALLQQGIGQ